MTSSTTAPWPSTRRAQLRLNASSASPMRVPPDQSGTACDTIWNATSGSRCAQLPGDVGQPRAEQEDVAPGRGRSPPRAGNAAGSARSGSSSRRCRTAPPAAAGASRARLRASSMISPPCAGWRGSWRAGRSAAPFGSGRRRRVRRRSSGSVSRRISVLAAAISAALIASKSIVCSRSRSQTVITASISSRSSGGSRFVALAPRSPRPAAGCPAARAPAAPPATPSIIPMSGLHPRRFGSRQNSANAWSNNSWNARADEPSWSATQCGPRPGCRSRQTPAPRPPPTHPPAPPATRPAATTARNASHSPATAPSARSWDGGRRGEQGQGRCPWTPPGTGPWTPLLKR